MLTGLQYFHPLSLSLSNGPLVLASKSRDGRSACSRHVLSISCSPLMMTPASAEDRRALMGVGDSSRLEILAGRARVLGRSYLLRVILP